MTCKIFGFISLRSFVWLCQQLNEFKMGSNCQTQLLYCDTCKKDFVMIPVQCKNRKKRFSDQWLWSFSECGLVFISLNPYCQGSVKRSLSPKKNLERGNENASLWFFAICQKQWVNSSK